MGRLVRSELERFEREKVEDFKSAVETWLESAVEAQKELIELWESYLLQLDREEEELAAEEARHSGGARKAHSPQADSDAAAAVATPVPGPSGSTHNEDDGGQNSEVRDNDDDAKRDGEDHSDVTPA